MDRPEIFVLGGPNGAGKTTIANVLLPEHVQVPRFVNADLIARGLDPYRPQASELEAGRLMLERIHQLREAREGATVYVPATWARIEEHDRDANA